MAEFKWLRKPNMEMGYTAQGVDKGNAAPAVSTAAAAAPPG